MKKVVNKTVIELDFKSLKNVLREFYNAPPEASISFSGTVTDDKSNSSRHDMRDPWPKKAKFKRIRISYDNKP